MSNPAIVGVVPRMKADRNYENLHGTGNKKSDQNGSVNKMWRNYGIVEDQKSGEEDWGNDWEGKQQQK